MCSGVLRTEWVRSGDCFHRMRKECCVSMCPESLRAMGILIAERMLSQLIPGRMTQLRLQFMLSYL